MQLKPSDSYQQVQVRSFLGGFFVKHGQTSLVSRKLVLFCRKKMTFHWQSKSPLGLFHHLYPAKISMRATLISPEVDTSMLLTHPILTVLATGENWRAMGCLSGWIAASEGTNKFSQACSTTLFENFSANLISIESACKRVCFGVWSACHGMEEKEEKIHGFAQLHRRMPPCGCTARKGQVKIFAGTGKVQRNRAMYCTLMILFTRCHECLCMWQCIQPRNRICFKQASSCGKSWYPMVLRNCKWESSPEQGSEKRGNAPLILFTRCHECLRMWQRIQPQNRICFKQASSCGKSWYPMVLRNCKWKSSPEQGSEKRGNAPLILFTRCHECLHMWQPIQTGIASSFSWPKITTWSFNSLKVSQSLLLHFLLKDRGIDSYHG